MCLRCFRGAPSSAPIFFSSAPQIFPTLCEINGQFFNPDSSFTVPALADGKLCIADPASTQTIPFPLLRFSVRPPFSGEQGLLGAGGRNQEGRILLGFISGQNQLWLQTHRRCAMHNHKQEVIFTVAGSDAEGGHRVPSLRSHLPFPRLLGLESWHLWIFISVAEGTPLACIPVPAQTLPALK